MACPPLQVDLHLGAATLRMRESKGGSFTDHDDIGSHPLQYGHEGRPLDKFLSNRGRQHRTPASKPPLKRNQTVHGRRERTLHIHRTTSVDAIADPLPIRV